MKHSRVALCDTPSRLGRPGLAPETPPAGSHEAPAPQRVWALSTGRGGGAEGSVCLHGAAAFEVRVAGTRLGP